MEAIGYVVVWLVLVLFGWTAAKRATGLVLKLLPVLGMLRRWWRGKRRSESNIIINIDYINITVPLEGDDHDLGE